MSDLVVKSLFKSYDGHGVLHGISFSVKKGQFLSLLGPSGCGKTTTLRCIAGLEAADKKSGEIKLGDEILSSPLHFVRPEKRGFGMVFQSYAVWPHMNVGDNITFPLKIAGASPAQRESKLKEILKLVHLDGLEKRFGHELSGGQQQRVALGRALIMSPRVLLLDEPLSNLDALLREELRVEIQRLQKQFQLTTILVTHDQKEALSLSDEIIILKAGKIEAQGTPENLFKTPPTPFVSQFLLGGQSVENQKGEKQIFIPKNWKVSPEGQNIKIVSRLYHGGEYEYWGQNEEFCSPLKFFAIEKYEIGARLNLKYL